MQAVIFNRAFETRTSIVLAIVAALATCALVPSFGFNDYAAGTLAFYVAPALIFSLLATWASLPPGGSLGAVTAFSSLMFLQTYWEVLLYRKPNSMPGFFFLFVCVPLSSIALLASTMLLRRWYFTAPVANWGLSFLVVSAPFGILLIKSFVRQW